MQTSEIIDGLKDLIKDREALIEPNAPQDNIFMHDKAVLQAAVDELSHRAAPETPQTNANRVRSMSDEMLAEMIYNISTNMCCNTVCPKPIHRSNECKPGQVYNCRNRILSWLRRKPEGSEP